MCSFISMAAPNAAVHSDCTLSSTDLISLFIAFDSLPLHCVRQQNLGVPYVLLQLSLNLVKLWLTLEGRGSSICSLGCVAGNAPSLGQLAQADLLTALFKIHFCTPRKVRIERNHLSVYASIRLIKCCSSNSSKGFERENFVLKTLLNSSLINRMLPRVWDLLYLQEFSQCKANLLGGLVVKMLIKGNHGTASLWYVLFSI